MPRLTAELIADSPQFTNPVKDWELDLRGRNYKTRIEVIFKCEGLPFEFEALKDFLKFGIHRKFNVECYFFLL